MKRGITRSAPVPMTASAMSAHSKRRTCFNVDLGGALSVTGRNKRRWPGGRGTPSGIQPLALPWPRPEDATAAEAELRILDEHAVEGTPGALRLRRLCLQSLLAEHHALPSLLLYRRA